MEKYLIGPKLGEGGFGKVYKVKEKATGKRFAMKIIKFKGDKKRLTAEFNTEIALLSSFSQENIAKLKDYFYEQDKDRYIIIMEYCSGGDLRNLISKYTKSNKKMP